MAAVAVRCPGEEVDQLGINHRAHEGRPPIMDAAAGVLGGDADGDSFHGFGSLARARGRRNSMSAGDTGDDFAGSSNSRFTAFAMAWSGNSS